MSYYDVVPNYPIIIKRIPKDRKKVNFMTNIFKVRCSPNGIDQLKTFQNNNIVAIGWPLINDITGCSRSDIANRLRLNYDDLKENNKKLGLVTGYFERLLSMRNEDLILIPYENQFVWIAKVIGSYQFDNSFNPIDCSHTVSVKFLKKVSVIDIPKDLKKSLNGPSTVAKLDSKDYLKYVNDLLNSEQLPITIFNGQVFETSKANKNIRLTISESVTDNDLKIFLDNVINSLTDN